MPACQSEEIELASALHRRFGGLDRWEGGCQTVADRIEEKKAVDGVFSFFSEFTVQ